VWSWTWTILRRDPVPLPLSSDVLARIQNPHPEDDVVSKERIFAAVGIKITPTNEEILEEPIEQNTEERLPKLPA
jgi:hypothetical protein